jgi:hypothetical protein
MAQASADPLQERPGSSSSQIPRPRDEIDTFLASIIQSISKYQTTTLNSPLYTSNPVPAYNNVYHTNNVPPHCPLPPTHTHTHPHPPIPDTPPSPPLHLLNLRPGPLPAPPPSSPTSRVRAPAARSRRPSALPHDLVSPSSAAADEPARDLPVATTPAGGRSRTIGSDLQRRHTEGRAARVRGRQESRHGRGGRAEERAVEVGRRGGLEL